MIKAQTFKVWDEGRLLEKFETLPEAAEYAADVTDPTSPRWRALARVSVWHITNRLFDVAHGQPEGTDWDRIFSLRGDERGSQLERALFG